jgi:ribonuclease HI
VIEVEGILNGLTSTKEKNVVRLVVRTDSLSLEELSILRELYRTGRHDMKPKAELKITFDNKVHKLLGAYKNAY